MASKGKIENLSGLVDLNNTNILNAEGRPSLTSLLAGTCGTVVKSDADEQLLVNVTFKSQVKIKAMKLTSADNEERPTVVKLFINQVSNRVSLITKCGLAPAFRQPTLNFVCFML